MLNLILPVSLFPVAARKCEIMYVACIVFLLDRSALVLSDDTLALSSKGGVQWASLEMVMTTSRLSWSCQWHLETRSSRCTVDLQ